MPCRGMQTAFVTETVIISDGEAATYNGTLLYTLRFTDLVHHHPIKWRYQFAIPRYIPFNSFDTEIRHFLYGEFTQLHSTLKYLRNRKVRKMSSHLHAKRILLDHNFRISSPQSHTLFEFRFRISTKCICDCLGGDNHCDISSYHYKNCTDNGNHDRNSLCYRTYHANQSPAGCIAGLLALNTKYLLERLPLKKNDEIGTHFSSLNLLNFDTLQMHI